MSWLTYYLYKAVFLTVVNLTLFMLKHKGIHEVKIFVHNGLFSQTNTVSDWWHLQDKYRNIISVLQVIRLYSLRQI